jgi:hypothetical protein
MVGVRARAPTTLAMSEEATTSRDGLRERSEEKKVGWGYVHRLCRVLEI